MHSTHPVSDAMLDRLWREADNCSDFVDVMLHDPGGRYGVDARDILIELLGALIALTGSEDDAIGWLFNSRGYTEIVGDDAYLNLSEGDFWALVTLRDWLKVIEAHQATSPDLIQAVFRKKAVAAGRPA